MVDDRIELPPCPDCGCAVDDVHIQEELVTRHRFTEESPVITPRRDVELLPCRCPVSQMTIQQIKGTQRVTEIHMKSGWRWTLGWSQTQETVHAATIIQTGGRVLTAGQTPVYDASYADD